MNKGGPEVADHTFWCVQRVSSVASAAHHYAWCMRFCRRTLLVRSRLGSAERAWLAQQRCPCSGAHFKLAIIDPVRACTCHSVLSVGGLQLSIAQHCIMHLVQMYHGAGRIGHGGTCRRLVLSMLIFFLRLGAGGCGQVWHQTGLHGECCTQQKLSFDFACPVHTCTQFAID